MRTLPGIVVLLTSAVALGRTGEPRPVPGTEGVDPETGASGTGSADSSPSCEPDPPVPTGETVIRAGEVPLSAGASSIPRSRIETSHPVSSSEVLALVPGLRIAQHGAEGKAHQIFLRGFDAVHGSDVEVLVDGVPWNERGNVHGHGYVDLYGVVPEAIRVLRVHKGPFLPGQGDFATAGSVCLETGLPDDLRPGLVRMDASHRGRTRMAFVMAPPGGPREAIVAGEAVFDPGWGPDREALRGTAHGAWVWTLAKGLRLRVFGGGHGGRWQSPGAVRLEDVESGRMGFRETYGTGGHGSSWRGQGGLSLTFRDGETNLQVLAWGGARGLHLTDDYTGFLLNGDLGDRWSQAGTAAFVGVTTTLDRGLPLAFPATLLVGLGWRFDRVLQREDSVDGQGRPWRRDRDLGARLHGVHADAGVRLQPWPWVEVLPSVRFDLAAYEVTDRLESRRADRVLWVASPRLAVALPVHRSLTLFADYGRGFRTPEARSITARPEGTVEDQALQRYRGGRPAIAVADAVEAGLEVRAPTAVTWRLAGFGTFLEREIVFDHVSNTNLEQNGTRRLGVEVSLEATLLPWLRLAADATWCDARFRRSGHAVPGTAPWSGRALLDLGLERGVHGGADLEWAGRRNLAHGATAAGHALLDLHLGWRDRRWDLTLVVGNVTGSDAMDGAYHFASWFDRSRPRSTLPVIHYTAVPPTTARIVWTAFL